MCVFILFFSFICWIFIVSSMDMLCTCWFYQKMWMLCCHLFLCILDFVIVLWNVCCVFFICELEKQIGNTEYILQLSSQIAHKPMKFKEQYLKVILIICNKSCIINKLLISCIPILYPFLHWFSMICYDLVMIRMNSFITKIQYGAERILLFYPAINWNHRLFCLYLASIL